MASRAHYVDVVTDGEGNLLPGAAVTVRLPGTEDPIPDTLFSDDDPDVSTLTNPFVVGTDGVCSFYIVNPQVVDLFITAGGMENQTRRDVLVNRLGLFFRAAYSAATQYHENDVVTNGGETWVALRDVIAVTPVEGADWTKLAAKGTPGDATFKEAGVTVGTRAAANFDGDDFDLTDDPGNNEVDIALSADVLKSSEHITGDPHPQYLQSADIAPLVVKEGGVADSPGRDGLDFADADFDISDDAVNNDKGVALSADVLKASAHGSGGDPHPQYHLESVHNSTGDPHTQYQKESEKNAANGYMGLDASGDAAKANQHPQTPYKDEANTFVPAQTIDGGLTIGASGTKITKIFSVTVSVNPSAAAAGTTDFVDVTVAGAALGDTVIGQPTELLAGNQPEAFVWSCYVKSSGTVRIQYNNPTTSVIDIGPLTWRFTIIRF